MPDIQNYTQTIGANQSINVPRVTFSFTVNDSVTGAVITDKTGANAVVFPIVFQNMTVARRQAFMDYCRDWMFREVMGLNP